MANKNANLQAAKKAKNDEFYTQRSDIENELCHYADHFRGKVVYCNCDDPRESEFWQFFVRNFEPWGLKKLIATHYETDAENFSYVLELSKDMNGDGVVNWDDEPIMTQLPCNGDFRSAACIELLKEADIVVTNPPFSLIKEYIGQLIEYDKKFLVIGPLNAVKYGEIFPLLMEDKVWLGYTHPKKFLMPSGEFKSFGNVMWFTNLDTYKRHTPLDLRGNYYAPEKYPKYVNYDAIEVGKVSDIPCDYDGMMGVPISFLEKYCPDQFEIVGMNWSVLADAVLSDDIRQHHSVARRLNFYLPIPDGHGNDYTRMFDRIVIRRKKVSE